MICDYFGRQNVVRAKSMLLIAFDCDEISVPEIEDNERMCGSVSGVLIIMVVKWACQRRRTRQRETVHVLVYMLHGVVGVLVLFPKQPEYCTRE